MLLGRRGRGGFRENGLFDLGQGGCYGDIENFIIGWFLSSCVEWGRGWEECFRCSCICKCIRTWPIRTRCLVMVVMAGQERSRGPHARRWHAFFCRWNRIKRVNFQLHWKKKKKRSVGDLKEWWNGDGLRWMEREEVAAIGAVRHRLGLRDSYLIDWWNAGRVLGLLINVLGLWLSLVVLILYLFLYGRSLISGTT